MSAAQAQIVPEVMDLKSITLIAEKTKPAIATVTTADGFFPNARRSSDFRLRADVYKMLKDAQSRLPPGFRFMIFETYRSFAKQEALWRNTNKLMKEKYPELNPDELQKLCENFTACPYDGIGSGHQCGCAIDLTLCNDAGKEYPLGTEMHEKNEKTKTEAAGLTSDEKSLRNTLKKAMEDAGFINYPAEWWHFSYGDHQWAFLAGRKECIYGILDI